MAITVPQRYYHLSKIPKVAEMEAEIIEETTKIFLLVITAIAILAVCVYCIIVKIYENRMEKYHKHAQEVFAKTANLNLRVDAGDELFKREKKE